MGYFEFRLCKIDGWQNDATQACLNKTVLTISNENGRTIYPIGIELRTVEYEIDLPKDLKCSHCVM
jgi:hypothetical protein